MQHEDPITYNPMTYTDIVEKKQRRNVITIFLIGVVCICLLTQIIYILYTTIPNSTDIGVISLTDNDNPYAFYIYDYTEPSGIEGKQELSHTGSTEYRILNSKYAIVTYKTDRFHRNRLRHHVLDCLVYFNDDTMTADILYESWGLNLIIYGNRERVLVYNANGNVVEYISIATGKVEGEIPLKLNKYLDEYCFEIDEENSVIIVTQISRDKIVKTLPFEYIEQ